MSTDAIQAAFRRKVSEAVRLDPEGLDRFYVSTPFQFPDGDRLVIVLRQVGGQWRLTDEGHTFMHLSYWLDERALRAGTRAKLIESVLQEHGIAEHDGALVLPIPDQQYGDALFTFVQAVLHLSDLTYLSRERVVSTFLEDLRCFVQARVPPERLSVGWHHPRHDPSGKYPVDFRINGLARPILLFGVNNKDRANLATITLLKFDAWREPVEGVAVYEDQTELDRRVVARLTDACGRQFSSWEGENQERFGTYLLAALERKT